jgi:hypothetical protein
MPRLSRVAVVVVCLLVPCASVRAGVYVIASQKDTPLLPMRDPFPVVTAEETVKSLVATLTMLDDAIAKRTEKTTTARADLIKEVETVLEPKLKKGELTPQDLVNLSAAYIRLRRYTRAIPVLEDGLRQLKEDAPERFLLLANLAAAHHGNNDLRNARNRQMAALAAAPAKPPVAAWSQERWDHYLIAERYYARLLERRAEEIERPSAVKSVSVDDLFPTVRFVGASGDYEPGRIAPQYLHELPRDALPIVVQLLFWLPTDPRLMWLYGELLNAEGRVNEAYFVMRDLIFSGSMGGKEISDHRRILQGALVPAKPEVTEDEVKAPPDQSNKPEGKPAATAGTDWRTLAIGFVAGLLVAAFGGLQLYLWLRRRVSARVSALHSAPPTNFAAAGKAEGITPADPGHVTAPRDRS